jgi:hypothetical protein
MIAMPDTFQPIHPRKLYATLLASTSVEQRAQATLAFLCGCTGSVRGYLFLTSANGLVPAADSGQGAPSADVVTEAERAWLQELDTQPDDNRTRTIDLSARRKPDAQPDDELWRSDAGVAYTRRVLGTYRGPRWVPVGIVLLEAGSALAPLRHAYIESVCNAFINAGDVPAQPADTSVNPT